MSRIAELVAELAPKGVRYESLAQVGTWYGGGTPSKGRPDFWENGTIPWVSPKDMGKPVVETTEDRITEAAVRGSATKLVPRNSVAVVARSSILDRILPTALIPMPVALNQDMKAVIPRGDILPGYLAHILRSNGPEILRAARKTGGSVASLESKKFFEFRIPLPPLEVQREIVRILDQFTELATELEASLSQEIESREEQHTYFRKQILNFVDGFDHVSLQEVADFFNAKAHEKLVDPEGGVALLTSRFISTNGRMARFVQAENVLTPALKGDVALVMSDLPNGRALARTFFVDANGKYAANQRVCLLRSRDHSVLLPRFLSYVLNRNPKLLAYDNGSDQTHLKKAYIQEMEFGLPPLHVQRQVVALLDELESQVSELVDRQLPAEIAARRKQYEYYRDKLLTFDEAIA